MTKITPHHQSLAQGEYSWNYKTAFNTVKQWQTTDDESLPMVELRETR